MDLNRAKENSQKREAQLEHDILAALDREINNKSIDYSDEEPHVVVCDEDVSFPTAIRSKLNCNKVSTTMINRIISTMNQRGFYAKYECGRRATGQTRCTLSITETWN